MAGCYKSNPPAAPPFSTPLADCIRCGRPPAAHGAGPAGVAPRVATKITALWLNFWLWWPLATDGARSRAVSRRHTARPHARLGSDRPYTRGVTSRPP